MHVVEKDFEDWVAQADNLNHVVGRSCSLVGRQYVLPTGRVLDLLASYEDAQGNPRLVVLELKREVIDNNAVLQIFDYMACLWELVESATAWGLGERPQQIEGVLLAPAIRPGTHRMIESIPNLTFVQLSVEIRIHRPEFVPRESDIASMHRIARVLHSPASAPFGDDDEPWYVEGLENPQDAADYIAEIAF